MTAIELHIKDFQKRKRHIMRLLEPISKMDSGPACEQRSLGNNILMLGAHEGNLLHDQIKEWRFSTPNRDCWANYYESWELRDSATEMYCLNKAYLTIYKRNRMYNDRTEKELLCLHCDPYEPGDNSTPAVVYKRSPHLHIEAADDPIPKAHFALALGNLDHVLTSVSNFTQALSLYVEMIRYEVLDRI